MPGYHLPWFTARAQEIYAEHGLDVSLRDPDPGPDNVRAVAAGRYDFCLTSVGHFLRAKAADPDLGARFVFMVSRRTHMAAFTIDGRPATHGRPIGELADLEGASVLGAEDSPFMREHLALLRHLALAPGPRVDIPYPRVMTALAEGRGDVAPDFLDLLPAFQTAAAPHGVRVRALPFHESGLEAYGSGLVTGTRMIAERPYAIARMVSAAREVLLAGRDAPQSGIAPMSETYPELDPGRALAGYRAGEPLVFAEEDGLGTMDAPTWQRTIEHHAQTHGTPRLAPEAAFDGSFAEALNSPR